MSSILCRTIISSKIPARSVGVSQKLLQKWGIHAGQISTLQLGGKKLSAKMIRVRSDQSLILLSPTLSRELCFPFHRKLQATYHGNTLQLGPVIGILTTGPTNNPLSPFGSRSNLFRTFLLEGAPKHVIYYVFSPELIDWRKKTIQGWYYEKEGWKKITSPFPNVIHERIPNRKSENTSSIQACLQRLRSMKIPIFNQGFFDKWTVHEWLVRNPVTNQYVPESRLSPSIHELERMLDRHQMIYLKPIRGSLGLGIYRITKHPTLGYYIRYHRGNNAILQRYSSLETMMKQYFDTRRMQNYIAQQGIRLIKSDNKAVDFRVHLHKDSSGLWKVITIAAKKAGEGCVTTHMRTGGSLLSTEEFLHSLPNTSVIRQKIQQAAIEIAHTVEANCDGPLGELGLDMGIDRNGRIWVFECNSKPGRHIFLHPTQKNAGRESARHIVLYSLKLSNFA